MDRAERVRQILATRSLALSNVSHQSAQIFGRSSRFYIPRNLCASIRDPSFLPTIHQLLALSRITNYRLPDWFAVFGCELDQIPRLQSLIPGQRTTLLDSSVYDTSAWIPWFAEAPSAVLMPPIAPLTKFVARASPKRALELLALNQRRFVYAKVGARDTYAVPYLAPGSIVRVDRERAGSALAGAKKSAESPFFLVEHAAGYSCSRLLVLATDRVLLHSPQFPCADRELRLGRDGGILGVVDAEIRPLGEDHDPPPMRGQPDLRHTRPRPFSVSQSSLRELLQVARARVGLSFRDASSLSRSIANALSDKSYFAAPGTLSDYETLSEPPRRIQKVVTLCVLYGIKFQEFLRIAGLPLDQAGGDPIPDELVPRTVPDREHAARIRSENEERVERSGFLGHLIERWEEIPLFLRQSLAELTALKNFSLSDVFWVGGERVPIHPLLIQADFVAVNRRVKTATPAAAKRFCTQPLYLLLKRDGTYLCGPCVEEKTDLVVPSYPGSPFGTQRFRNGLDAEVIGRLTAILRRVL